jgi:hypothetical protein
MTNELCILSETWQNFLKANWHDSLSPTVGKINKLLKPHGAYVKDIGEWRVYFNNEQDLTMFIMRYT